MMSLISRHYWRSHIGKTTLVLSTTLILSITLILSMTTDFVNKTGPINDTGFYFYLLLLPILA